MKIIIAVARPCDSEAVRERFCETGMQSVAVPETHAWLEVVCDDDQFKPVIAALTHDSRIKAAFVCVNETPRWIMDLTWRSPL
ncbi:MAG: hypothetical protein L0H63_03105 [Nitrococcus sp.]|nr:hypothetical protein [Nitrococcus sp.]